MNIPYIQQDNRFRIKKSTIPFAGLGVFANTVLPEETKLHVDGIVIQKNSTADICTAYANKYKFKLKENLLLIPLGWAGMVNHSNKPNMFKLVKNNGKVFLVTNRDITPGEELFWKYSKGAL